MNQISPRVFEAITLRTVLVLFEGDYSGVLQPNVHFIPLKKDGSNLSEVFLRLKDGNYVDQMAERAYQDVIASGRYSYKSFVHMVDEEMAKAISLKSREISKYLDTFANTSAKPSPITTAPIRAIPPRFYGWKDQPMLFAEYVWRKLPRWLRNVLKLRMKRLLGRS